MCEYEIKELPLCLKSARKKLEIFLAQNGLLLDELDYYIAAYDIEDEIIAGAGLYKNIIKCVAVSASAREWGLTNSLVSSLQTRAFEQGYLHTILFTKPENQQIFESLGYHLIGKAKKAILIDSDLRVIERYKDSLKALTNEGVENGVVVMNCNPFTMGHLYLLKEAAKRVNRLYIIPVEEDKSYFTTLDRENMIRDAIAQTGGLENVTLCKGSQYTISAATFPSYFIKELSDVAITQMELDCDIFARHFAPALNAKYRFVGSEPTDKLTCSYNNIMRERLSQSGVEVIEFERYKANEEVVSASKVRAAIEQLDIKRAFALTPQTTHPYLIAYAASRALKIELELTPKPGLVDKIDSGAHKDMNYELMSKSIDALTPYFVKLAQYAASAQKIDAKEIQTIGIEAEKAMFAATNGVNSHKGALFAMGVALVSYFASLKNGDNLSSNIATIAKTFVSQQDTHGAKVSSASTMGALKMAQSGYQTLFEEWLPYYRSIKNEENAHLKLLYKIISSLDDTNILYRGGNQGLEWAKEQAKELLNNFSLANAEALKKEFISKNLSAGGSADMFSLTLFIDALIH